MEKSRAIELLEHLAWDRDIERNPCRDALNMAIDALKAQLSRKGTTSDMVSRQTVLDAIVQCTNCGDEDTLRKYVLKHNLDNGWTGGILEALDAVKDLPPVQPEVLACGNGELVAKPEPAIPLSWIEKYIEWLKSLDNEFANLAAAHISVMVKKWRDEKK